MLCVVHHSSLFAEQSDALTVRMKHNQDQLGAIAKHIKESQDKFLATIREGDGESMWWYLVCVLHVLCTR